MDRNKKNKNSHTSNLLYSFIPLLIIGFLLLGLSGSDQQANTTDKETEQIMESLNSYLGEWKSDTKTNADKEYHFIYSLEYFNATEAKSIVKMTIIQQTKGEGETLLWEGFKGINPVENKVYYYGFSPSGRVGKGHMYISNENLITEYEGFSYLGNAVKLRDVFAPIKGNSFTSTTSIKRDGENWMVIAEDEWTRID